VIAPMMYLALSYDHRIIDGKDPQRSRWQHQARRRQGHRQ